MRRIATLLVMLAIVGCGWSVFDNQPGNVPGSDAATADDDPPREAKPDAPDRARRRAGDRFAVPRGADVATLVEFVRRLRDDVPTTGVEANDYAELAPLAIRQACERILRLDKDPNSPDRHFAQREMLALDIELLSLVEDGGKRRAAIERLREVLLARPTSVDDAELALDLAAMGEDLESPEFVKPLFESLAKHYGSSDDPEVVLRSRVMRGAIRRLGLVGQPLALVGKTADGKPFDLAQWKGKVVVVDFWADWTGANLEEWSNLKRNYLAYHPQGLEVVSVNLAESRDHLDQDLARQRVPWVTLYDNEQGQHHPAAVDLGIINPPRRMLVNQQGIVVSIDVRGRHLRRQLRKLLGPPQQSLAGTYGFPVFNSGEVIERLCDAGEELLEGGRFTAATSLRPDLAQRSCKLKLPAASNQPLADDLLFRRVAESVFVVGTLYKGNTSADFDLSLATAFAVTPDGVLSTSYHVFDDDPEALVSLVMDVHGQTYPVEEILAADEAADTCLVRIPAKGLKPLAFAIDAAPGTRARIVSHPGDSFYFLSTGHVSNYERDDDGVVWMNVTAEFGQGSSGGPVVDGFGNVIGQVSRTATMYAGDPLDPLDDKPLPHGHVPRHHHRRGALPDSPALPEIPAWMEPQMIFRTCVPALNLRKLVEPQ